MLEQVAQTPGIPRLVLGRVALGQRRLVTWRERVVPQVNRGHADPCVPGVRERPVGVPPRPGTRSPVDIVQVGESAPQVAPLRRPVVVRAEGDLRSGIGPLRLMSHVQALDPDLTLSPVDAQDMVGAPVDAEEVDEIRLGVGEVDPGQGPPVVARLGIDIGRCHFHDADAGGCGEKAAVSDPIDVLMPPVHLNRVVRDGVLGPARTFGPAAGVLGVAEVGHDVHAPVVHADVETVLVAVTAVPAVVEPGGTAALSRSAAEGRQPIAVEIGTLQVERSLPLHDPTNPVLDGFGLGIEDRGVEPLDPIAVQLVGQLGEVGLPKPLEGLDGQIQADRCHARVSGLAGVTDSGRVPVERGEAVGRCVHPTQAGIVPVQVVAMMLLTAFEDSGARAEPVHPDEAVARCSLVAHTVSIDLPDEGGRNTTASLERVARLEDPVDGLGCFARIVQNGGGGGHGGLGHALVSADAPVSARRDELPQEARFDVIADGLKVGLGPGERPLCGLFGQEADQFIVPGHPLVDHVVGL